MDVGMVMDVAFETPVLSVFQVVMKASGVVQSSLSPVIVQPLLEINCWRDEAPEQ